MHIVFVLTPFKIEFVIASAFIWIMSMEFVTVFGSLLPYSVLFKIFLSNPILKSPNSLSLRSN